ncbi:MAG: RHS repeat protein, partial [Acidobacteria bacterium]|nr:RHS repeat protein [Acidobacteriota bacterium]
MRKSVPSRRHVLLAVLPILACVVALSALAVPPRAPEWGDAPTFEAKGVDASQLYFAIGGAEVNAFNFNFVVSFSEQVGFEAPVDGGLSLSLARVYNSAIYRERSWQCQYPCLPELEPGTAWQYLSIPRQNPLGLGWEFHLGRIYRKGRAFCGGPPRGCGDGSHVGEEGYWSYVAPDGAEHDLVWSAESTATENVYYSHDGSLLRAVQHGIGTTPNPWTLYLPDGKVVEFQHEVTGELFEEVAESTACFESSPLEYFRAGQPPAGSYERDKLGWYATRIATREVDGAGQPRSWIAIEYQDAPFDYILKRVWDSHHDAQSGPDRAVEIVINSTEASAPSYGHITQLQFPAPPALDGAPRPKAALDFAYERKTLAIAGQPHPVELLACVTLPGGYRFEYQYHDTPPGAEPDPLGQGEVDFGGRLARISYPSGKLVQLTYGRHHRLWRSQTVEDALPDGCSSCIRRSETHFVGLARKEEFLDGNAGNTDPANYRAWTFSARSEETGPPLDSTEPCSKHDCGWKRAQFSDAIATMDDAAGNRSEIRFDTHAASGSTEPSKTADFGRPIVETYRSGTDGAVLKQVSRTWRTRHQDACHGVMWATQSSETVDYLDDTSPARVTTSSSDWNAKAGQYETTTVSGNGIGDWQKIVRTDYAIDNTSEDSSLCPSAEALYAAWLPGVVASRSVSVKVGEEAEQLKELTQFAFDTATGRTTGQVARLAPALPAPCAATLAALAPAPGDVVTSYEFDAAGNVVHEGLRFGQDANEAFGSDTDWSFGVAVREQNSALSYASVLRTVDGGTGLVTREESGAAFAGDPAGVARELAYDELRRPLRDRAGSLEPWSYAYENEPLESPNGCGARWRLARVRTSRGSGDALVEGVEHYDRAGRVVKSEKLGADGTRAYRHLRFNRAGLPEFASEWTAQAEWTAGLPGTTTSYTRPDGHEDPFGRAHAVTGALGEVTTTSYFGTNRSVTVHGVAGGTATEEPFDATTTYYTDGLGRLRAVDAPAGADAVYTYDESDRLLEARLVSQLALSPTATDRYATGNPPGQLRTFTFDALGRQTSATQPENGTTATLSWNALGQPLEVQDALGAERGHRHRTTYDGAGRPTLLERVAAPGAAVLDEVFAPDDPGWTAEGWSASGAPCLGEESWYHGTAQCQYARTAPQLAR